MKTIQNILMLTAMLVSFNSSIGQINNEKTVSEKISGNCGMCKKTIEKAGNVKDIASVDWDKETKMASISYDAKKTNKDEILERIALAGYDNDSFLAPDEAYNNLPNCCQYNRENKTATIEKAEMKMEMKEKMKTKSPENTKVFNNEKTVSEKILGNCGMCKKTIEKAGNVKDIASVDWDKETKMASISYDAKKTNKDEILKRIALAGYDNDSFLAPDEAYNNLPSCCQYNRENKTAIIEKAEMKMEMKEKMKEKMKMKSSENPKPLELVYNTYFELKDALVASDSKVVSDKANDLLASIEKVDMKSLKMDVHMVWMKNLKSIKEEVKIIASAKKIEQQRQQFIDLSDNMYKLMKIEKLETPIYYQHCPMANDGKGANWLSKEGKVKNPYYGSKMLSCGKVIETIK